MLLEHVGGRRTPKWSIPTFAASAHPAQLYFLFPAWLQPLPSSSSSSGSALKPLHLVPPVSPFISPQQTEPPSIQPQFHHHSLPINHPEYFYFVNKMMYSSWSRLCILCVVFGVDFLPSTFVCVIKEMCTISCNTAMLWMSLKAALLLNNKM